MRTPTPRGTLSSQVLHALRSERVDARLPAGTPDDELDAQLTLWVLYELHYSGFDDVSDDLEWHPTLLRLRRGLEERFEAALRASYRAPDIGSDVARAIFGYIEAHDGPSISRYVQHDATRAQVLELLEMRSVYHLKEADPVAWVVPRLAGPAGAALMTVQFDEYGGGEPSRLHASLFADGLAAMGLEVDTERHVDAAPVEVLQQNNAMSLFGLHRRLRGAALGHLAAFEATSSLPSRRMSQGLRRVGLAQQMQAYYDEHIEADAVHEQMVVRQVCAVLLESEPALTDDVFFGAHTCLELESRFAARMLAQWAGHGDPPSEVLSASA